MQLFIYPPISRVKALSVQMIVGLESRTPLRTVAWVRFLFLCGVDIQGVALMKAVTPWKYYI